MTNTRMVITGVAALVLSASPLFELSGRAAQASQTRQGQPSDDAPRTGSQTRETGETTRSPAGATDSAAFVRDMTVAGMAEVQLGNLAAQRASNAEVKAYGQMMVKDHTAASNELKAIVANMRLQAPTSVDQKHRDLAERLGRLQGAEFDRAYMDAMVASHEEVAGKMRMRTGRASASGDRTGSAASERVSPSGESGNPPPADASGRTQNQSQGSAQPRTDGQRSTSAANSTDRAGEGELALKQWTTRNLAAVERHLEQARELRRKIAN
jgi:putative membrane protein